MNLVSQPWDYPWFSLNHDYISIEETVSRTDLLNSEILKRDLKLVSVTIHNGSHQ